MDIQDRKRYNLVIFVLFITGFFLYGGLSLLFWLLPDSGINDSLFHALPPFIRFALSFIIYGLLGGWVISGAVGGCWLGGRFVRRRGKKIVVLACVLFPFTFIAFIYAGLFGTIPFAVYNVVLIRRNHANSETLSENGHFEKNTAALHEDNSWHEAAGYFESKIIITEDIYNELKWIIVPSITKIAWLVISLAAIGFVAGAFYTRNYIAAIICLVVGVAFSLKCVQVPKSFVRSMMERDRETSGGAEACRVVSFHDDKIHVHNENTGGKVYLNYDSIVRFVDTKSTYTLITKTNQFVPVNKITLTQKNKNEVFIHFLKDKCKNARWPRMRSTY